MLASDIFNLVDSFQHPSLTYQATRGVHSAALCSGRQVIVWAEDTGRHNAVDKVLGQCFLDGIPTEGFAIFSSGRIASDVVHKTIKTRVPIILSVAVPTSLAVGLAHKKGITIVGSLKDGSMTAFAHEGRIVVDNQATP